MLNPIRGSQLPAEKEYSVLYPLCRVLCPGFCQFVFPEDCEPALADFGFALQALEMERSSSGPRILH